MDLHANQHPPEQAIPPPGRRQQLRDARAQMEAYPASQYHELPGRSNVIWCFMDYNKCARDLLCTAQRRLPETELVLLLPVFPR